VAVVLLTGGTSGIGFAAAKQLSAAGDEVFVAARRAGERELPERCIPLTLDVADPSAAQTAVDAVLERAGRLDALVNNAGTGPIGPFEEADDTEAHRIFEVNLFGPLRLMRAAIPVMRAQGGGRIINVTSLNDLLPAPFASLYSATKAALATASNAIDAEIHRFGISVSVIAPGFFRTEMAEAQLSYSVDADSLYRVESQRLQADVPKRLDGAGDPDDVGRAIFECIHAPDAPSRVIVGLDALGFEKLVRGATPDELRQMLRDYCAQLTDPRTGP
jgi:NAD(P)-dependent dehydrogenase (short-subunit alcohol dehydrogenase family)